MSLMDVNIYFCSSYELITESVFLDFTCFEDGLPPEMPELVLCPSSRSSRIWELWTKFGSSSLPKFAV
jgi:hypothetical protein